MKVLKFTKVGAYAYEELDMPSMQDDQLLIKVECAGICHSDIVSFTGMHPYRIPPVVTGHEFSGVVVKAGVKAGKGFSIGTRVAVEPHIGCGVCQYCRKGHYNICQNKRLIGVDDWSGSFSEYVVAYPSMCIKMPDSMTFDEGALLEPFCVGAHAARLTQLSEKSSVAVLGCGTIGIMTIVSLKQLGVGTIIGSDISEIKGSFATSQGATHMLNPMRMNIVDSILSITNGEGVDAVFIASSFPGVFEQAYGISKRKGRVIIIALFEKPVVSDITPVQQGERVILGSNMYTMDDYRWAISKYETGKLDLAPLVTRRIPFLEAGEVIRELSQGKHGDEVKIMISI